MNTSFKTAANTLYDFLFHPLKEENTAAVKAGAIVTDLALTVLTGGFFLLVFLAIQLKDRNIKHMKDEDVQSGDDKVKKTASGIFGESPPSPVNTSLLESASSADKLKALVVKNKQAEQLKSFEEWASKGQWKKFHDSHYDWWMFPITRASMGQGDTYAVNEKSIAILKNDPEFMTNYRRGIELVARSWGWEVALNAPTENPSSAQKWADWPVRLGKMADSMKLFGEDIYLVSMKNFTIHHTPYQFFPDWITKALDIPN